MYTLVFQTADNYTFFTLNISADDQAHAAGKAEDLLALLDAKILRIIVVSYKDAIVTNVAR